MLNWIKSELQKGRTLISYGGIKIGGQTAAFLVPLILAVRFDPKIFGTYSLSMMIIYFFNSALIMSSGKPAIIFGSEEIKESQQINATITSRIILLSLSLMIFIVFAFSFKRQIIFFTGLTDLQIWFLVLVFIGKTAESFFSCMFLALNKRILESVYSLVSAALSIIYIMIIYFFFSMTLEKVFMMFFIAPILSICLFVSKIDFKKILPLTLDKKNLLKMTDFTKWMIFGGTGVYLLNWGDNIILRRFVAMEEIGIYNLGYQFFKGTIMIMMIIKMYFLPFISQHIGHPEKIRYYLTVKRTKLFLMGMVLLIGTYLVMPYFIKVLYRPEYQGAAMIFRLLLVGSICTLYSGFYDPIFDSMRRYKFIQVITVCGVALNLSLDYILVGRIGFAGAAIATSITYFLMALSRELYFRRYCRKVIY